MMLGRALNEASRLRDIVVAVEQQEITLREFSDAIQSLTPEALQVTALLLKGWTDLDEEDQSRVWQARRECQRLASQTRNLS